MVPKVIKIDVEGAELEVIESLKGYIHKFQPIILMEILPSYTEGNQVRIGRQHTISAMFDELGYQIYRIIKSPSNNFSHLLTIKNNEIEVH